MQADSTYPLTTAQMRQDSSFLQWDFSSIWTIRADTTYPALQGIDNAPFAFVDSFSLGAPVSINRFLDNDYDYETLQSALVVMIVDSGSFGITDGMVYRPTTAEAGDTDSLVYRVGEVRENDTLWGNRMNVYLTVLENSAPTLRGDTLETEMSTTLGILLDSLADDQEETGMTFTLAGSCRNGYAEISGDSLVYAPDDDYAGLDSLKMIVSDGSLSDTGWVFISIVESSSSSDTGSSSSAATESSSSSEGSTFTVAGTNSLSAQLNIRSASGPLNIAYTISRSGDVDIVFYNVLGMKAHELHQGPQAAGSHTAFEKVALPAGRYIAVLRLDGVTQDRSSWIMH